MCTNVCMYIPLEHIWYMYIYMDIQMYTYMDVHITCRYMVYVHIYGCTKSIEQMTFPHMNDPCLTSRMNDPCPTYKESCPIYKRVMSHIWISHVPRISFLHNNRPTLGVMHVNPTAKSLEHTRDCFFLKLPIQPQA